MVFKSHMTQALDQARAAAERGEVPVGAVIVDPNGRVVAETGNRTRELSDPTAHAEILAIRAACAAAGSERLNGYDLYVTLEPCAMCAAAIGATRIARLYYGASDPKSGGVRMGQRCSRILRRIMSRKSMTESPKTRRARCCSRFLRCAAISQWTEPG